MIRRDRAIRRRNNANFPCAGVGGIGQIGWSGIRYPKKRIRDARVRARMNIRGQAINQRNCFSGRVLSSDNAANSGSHGSSPSSVIGARVYNSRFARLLASAASRSAFPMRLQIE